MGSVSKYRFNNVDWETQSETICLQSTLFPPINSRNPNQKLRIVQAVAIFEIMPIKFVGLFEIDQAVSHSQITISSCLIGFTQQVFGKEVNSANISEGLLIIGIGTMKSAKIRIYSLKEILTEKNRLFNATLDMKCDDLGGKVGQYPFGLPLNYRVMNLLSLMIAHFNLHNLTHFNYRSNICLLFCSKSNAVNRTFTLVAIRGIM